MELILSLLVIIPESGPERESDGGQNGLLVPALTEDFLKSDVKAFYDQRDRIDERAVEVV